MTIMFIELGDWPGAQLSVFECKFPDAPDGGIDLVLPMHCVEHQRNWYWCPNASTVWCDGGPDGWQVHLWDGTIVGDGGFTDEPDTPQ